MAPASAASQRSNTLPSSEVDLMSQRDQRISSAVTAGTPLSIASAEITGSFWTQAKIVGRVAGCGT